MRQINLTSFKDVPLTRKRGFPKRINTQLYFFRTEDGRICAYTPIGNIAALLSNSEYEFARTHNFVNSNVEGMEELLDSFVYTVQSVNAAYPSGTALSFSPKIDKDKIRELSLIVSTACNLRCRYCFALGGESAAIEEQKGVSGLRQELDPDAALYAVRHFKPAKIVLFGWGEPTMALSSLKRIVADIDTAKIEVEIVTNGVYLSKREEIVRYLVEHHIRIELSFDGLPEFQDKYRPLANGGGSASEVLKTIEEIKRYGRLADFATVRATVCGGMENRIQECVDYLHSLGFETISIQPVEMSGRAVDNVKLPDLDLFARNIARAIANGKEQGINVDSRVLPAGSSWSMACYGCGFMAGYMLALGPDLNFYACDDPLPIFRVGAMEHRRDGFEIDVNYDKLTEFANKRYALNLKNCSECPVKCGGGCTKESLATYGSIDVGGESEELCSSRREALAEYIRCALA